MASAAFKNITLGVTNSISLYEHVITLRLDFQFIAAICDKKGLKKISTELIVHLKKSYDNLTVKILAQSPLTEVIADFRVGFDRVQTQIQKQNFEHTRTLKDLSYRESQMDPLKQWIASETGCDASETRLLIKLRDISNKASCRQQSNEDLCIRVNEAIRRDDSISIFSDQSHEGDNNR